MNVSDYEKVANRLRQARTDVGVYAGWYREDVAGLLKALHEAREELALAKRST